MSFYSLDKHQRQKLVKKIYSEISNDICNGKNVHIDNYFSDNDTYIRRTAYKAIGKLYRSSSKLQNKILHQLTEFLTSNNEKIRQTAINAAGEIGIYDFIPVEHLLEQALFDKHHSVRNAVIGSLKKMGQKNPDPIIKFVKKFIHHKDKEVRREICHGIELRGRTHPQEILPVLKELQHEKTPRVRNTLIHVIGQIAYKKGCLKIVVAHLKKWKNNNLVNEAMKEIIDVHYRYKNFAAKTQKQAIEYIEQHYYNRIENNNNK